MAAINAYHDKVHKIMDDQNLKEFQMDYSQIDESQFDVEWDYVQVLCEVIPGLRNSFAHGSKDLYNDVLGFFEDISIIINIIYQDDTSKKEVK